MKFREAIEEIRVRTDIVELIGSHVTLKRAGRNFLGLCPFHNEKTPSFNVSQEKQFFHCFGCQAGGSVFDFVMRLKSLSFAETVHFLADRNGIAIEPDHADAESEKRYKERDALYAVNREAALFFHQTLISDAGVEARRYLNERGISDDWVRRYGLGFAPDTWDSLTKYLTTQQVSPKHAQAIGLIAARDQGQGHYDRFRGRIMFPIIDTKRNVLGFGGRVFLEEHQTKQAQGKYINSPQSPVFDKSRTFYLLDQAEGALRQKREAIVVEGYFDAVQLHAHGIENVVATLGTAMTSQHGRMLARFVDRVICVFDGDDAGKRAAFKTLAPLTANGLDAKVVLLPEGTDPDSLVREQGAESFSERISAAWDLLDFTIQFGTESAKTTRDKAQVLEDIAKTLISVPNAVQRDLWLNRFRTLTSVTEETTKSLELKVNMGFHSVETNVADGRVDSGQTAQDELTGEEEMLLCLAFDAENVYELLRSYEGPPLFADGLVRDILEDQFAQGGKRDVLEMLASIQDAGIKARLERLLFKVSELSDEGQLHAARDCMRKILKKNFKKRMADLSRQIEDAERAQDDSLVLDLLQRKKDLIKSAQQS